MHETSGFLNHEGARLAWRLVDGAGPTVIWLGGFHSEMTGAKGEALAGWAAKQGRACLRFDYFGHGQSQGRFEDGTISRWRGDALAVIDRLTQGPLVLVGSSMGGWLACLAALARPTRITGMVLIAPAADFTQALLAPRQWTRPSQYGDEGYPITRALLEDGARWTILPGPLAIDVPVRILQGAQDPDVPWEHALELARALKTPDVVFTLIGDGDHRLSRLQDIRRLIGAVEELIRARG
jgi:pimeloyl-ACP methyl ester carboxylesterase